MINYSMLETCLLFIAPSTPHGTLPLSLYQAPTLMSLIKVPVVTITTTTTVGGLWEAIVGPYVACVSDIFSDGVDASEVVFSSSS